MFEGSQANQCRTPLIVEIADSLGGDTRVARGLLTSEWGGYTATRSVKHNRACFLSYVFGFFVHPWVDLLVCNRVCATAVWNMIYGWGGPYLNPTNPRRLNLRGSYMEGKREIVLVGKGKGANKKVFDFWSFSYM